MTAAAIASFSAARYSPSAWMTFARRSRIGLGLPGDRPDHLLGQFHLLYLDQGDLHAP